MALACSSLIGMRELGSIIVRFLLDRPPGRASVIRQRATSILRQPGYHAFGARCGEPSADQVGQHVDREAMRQHDRLGAAVAGCGEQFERAAAGGGRVSRARVAASVSYRGHIVSAYGTAMRKSRRAGRIATGRAGTAELAG